MSLSVGYIGKRAAVCMYCGKEMIDFMALSVCPDCTTKQRIKQLNIFNKLILDKKGNL